MSEGRPNQRGLQLDAQAALEHLLGRDDVPRSSIVVFGRSLGGAVAIHLAAENQDKVTPDVIYEVQDEVCLFHDDHVVLAACQFVGCAIPGKSR